MVVFGVATVCSMMGMVTCFRRGVSSAVLVAAIATVTGCAPAGVEGAAEDMCEAELDWSTREAGAESYAKIEAADLEPGNVPHHVYLRARELCPDSFIGYDKWRSDYDSYLNQRSPLNGSEHDKGRVPSTPPKTREECGRLGGWVADQDEAGRFTEEEYSSWLGIVGDCHRRATR